MRVLVVEDDPDLCEVLRDFLLAVGHEPLIVHTAEAALDWLRGERPDAVLLDVRLPGMSGLDFLRLQAVRDLRVPILVMSGNVTEHQAHECLQLGAFDFIGKPLPLSRLEELLACLGPAAATTGRRGRSRRAGAPSRAVVLPVRFTVQRRRMASDVGQSERVRHQDPLAPRRQPGPPRDFRSRSPTPRRVSSWCPSSSVPTSTGTRSISSISRTSS
jgi:DNA-binding response OmpR family regulator